MNYDDFLKTPRPCPFDDAMGKGIITENDVGYITYSLAPYHPDHLLVIPKRHIEEILDVTEKEEAGLYALIHKALKMLHQLGYKDMSVLVRDGEDGMKTVAHLHYNIIPKTHLGDIDHQGIKRALLSAEEEQAVFDRMKAVV